jgi:type I restriction enzyme R subunit
MLYEIISPDAFLRPFMDDYGTLSAIYAVVRKAYSKRVQVDREFQRKTNRWCRSRSASYEVRTVDGLVEINAETIELIKQRQGGDATKVINLVKGIEKTADEKSDDPFLVEMAARARVVQESYENQQTSTRDALNDLLAAIEKNEERKRQQAEKGFDSVTFYVYETLTDAGVTAAERVSKKIKEAFLDHPNWRSSEADLRELRKTITFAVVAEMDDLDHVTRIVDDLLSKLQA